MWKREPETGCRIQRREACTNEVISWGEMQSHQVNQLWASFADGCLLPVCWCLQGGGDAPVYAACGACFPSQYTIHPPVP